jgi:polar amino acid transport system substrate-binding protein
MGFRKTDVEFKDNFNKALAKVMANPAKMLERAGEYGYGAAQFQPAHMTTSWACSR